MSTSSENPSWSLQPFVPEPEAVYSLDAAARLARMPRRLVLLCCQRELVAAYRDPDYGGYAFDAEAIRTLQRIQFLREECGVNFTGIEIILELMDEVRRLRRTEDWPAE